MTDAPAVRLAAPQDTSALARCHLACWREVYAGIVPADTLAALTGDVEARTRRWRDILRTEPRRTWLAVADDEVLGFASAGPARDQDLEHLSELYALYVRSSAYGSGLANRLVEPAIGAAPAFLWVAAENRRAVRYYRKVGFQRDGRGKIDHRFGGIREVRMVRGDGSRVQK